MQVMVVIKIYKKEEIRIWLMKGKLSKSGKIFIWVEGQRKNLLNNWNLPALSQDVSVMDSPNTQPVLAADFGSVLRRHAGSSPTARHSDRSFPGFCSISPGECQYGIQTDSSCYFPLPCAFAEARHSSKLYQVHNVSVKMYSRGILHLGSRYEQICGEECLFLYDLNK